MRFLRASAPSFLLFCSVAIGIPGTAAASPIVWPSSGPTLTSGGARDLVRFQVADDFQLDASYLITDVHFWTMEDPQVIGPDPIQYWFYSGAPGGTTVASGSIASGSYSRALETANPNGSPFNRYAYGFDLPVSVLLEAGTTYWLSLHFGDVVGGAPNGQAWVLAVEDTLANYWYFNGSSWTQNNVVTPVKTDWDLAFQLTGSEPVPEPATLVLLGTGLVAAAVRARRRRATRSARTSRR